MQHERSSAIWGRYDQDVSGATSYWDSLAWYQVFNYGNQDSYYKGAEARARAVRLIHLSA